ncbi:MAG: dienelactone hydrolase family protein [Acidimicrobiales bacterium]|jgi:predicted dienelactone hydrolase|nr:dienelactone hydrolase family protein [Acidimicrobiales bacterium]
MAVAAVLLLGACSDDETTTESGSDATALAPDGTSAPGGTAEDDEGDLAGVDYSERGPYPVGLTTRAVGEDGREAVIYYPADDEATADAEPLAGYSSAIAFPEAFQAAVPPELIQDIALTDVYEDVPVSSEGPFPVVLHSHGAGGHYWYESLRNAHLASWGFVVAAPDHRERNLAASFTGANASAVPDADVADLENTLAMLDDANVEDGGPLAGAVDTESLGVSGHSAGGRAAVRMALENDQVDTVILYAPASPIPFNEEYRTATPERQVELIEEGLAALTPPDIPTLTVPGEVDATIPLDRVLLEYDWLAAPKRLVVLDAAGHNAFTDACAPIRAQGGLLQYADKLPGIEGLLQRGEDGCTEDNLDTQLGYDAVNHLTVAQLRLALGLDETDASLDPTYLEETFPEAIGQTDVQS